MEAVEISGQWYVVRWLDKAALKFVRADSLYSEEWQAVSAARLKETKSGFKIIF